MACRSASGARSSTTCATPSSGASPGRLPASDPHRRRRAVGFERLLLRWQHPERGNVPPDLFIPISEETGSILAIGEWVQRETCARRPRGEAPAHRRQRLGGPAPRPGLRRAGARDPVHLGPDAGPLEIEITETALIRDLPRALATLRRIKAMGVRIAMDDSAPATRRCRTCAPSRSTRSRIDASFTRSSIRASRRRRSCGPCSASAGAWACRSWRRASRPPASSPSWAPRPATSAG